MRKLLIVISPVLLIGVLQAGGCLRRTPAPPPPGGTYFSESAGASFEQAVALEGPDVAEGSHLARFDLRGAHRPPFKPTDIYIAAAAQGIVVSRSDGKTWQQITTPLTSAEDVALLENGVLVATGTGPEGQGFVIRSLDAGKSWQTVLTVPVPTRQGPFQIVGGSAVVPSVILTIEPDPFDANRLYAGSNLGGILVGEQSAKIWRTIHTVTPGRFDPAQSNRLSSVEKLVPSPHVKGELLVITAEHKLWRVSEGKQTEIVVPKAQTPEEKKFFISKGNYDVLDVTFAEKDKNLLLAGVTNAVVLSHDGGETWRELPVPVEAVIQFNSIRVAVSPTNPNRFLVGINTVVYRSEDAGSSWNTFSLRLPDHKIIDLLINSTNASKVLAITVPLNA